MQIRTSSLVHKPSGVTLNTPILIPSFSSKGFSTSATGETSEIQTILRATSEFITGSFLISAYDLHYGYVPNLSELTSRPDLIFVDSGGFEVRREHDLSAITRPVVPAQKWTPEMLNDVLSEWPDEHPAVFVNYDHPDHPKEFKEQVAEARKLFKGKSAHLHAFLIKPETENQKTVEKALGSAMGDADQLKSFDIIGVAEKDLGQKIIDRMIKIARLRRAMDEAGVSAPIHVFGSLDPISVCLYYFSGAEIFDGLTWIRYAYDKDMCVYPQNFGALKYGIHVSSDLVLTRMMADNYYYLLLLEEKLKDFESTKNFSKLPYGEFLKESVDTFERRMKKGGA